MVLQPESSSRHVGSFVVFTRINDSKSKKAIVAGDFHVDRSTIHFCVLALNGLKMPVLNWQEPDQSTMAGFGFQQRENSMVWCGDDFGPNWGAPVTNPEMRPE
jgi:hypothetical protein